MNAHTQKPDYIIIGRIIKPHGVMGALKVEPITDDPQRFHLLQRVYLGAEDAVGDPYKIKKVQFQNGLIILQLDNITSRDEAERLRNLYLHIPFDEALPLPDGAVYLFDLIGLEVFTNENKFVGTVKDVQEFPASDIFVVENGEKEYLIPDVPDIVTDVNLDAGRITINPIEGLLD